MTIIEINYFERLDYRVRIIMGVSITELLIWLEVLAWLE